MNPMAGKEGSSSGGKNVMVGTAIDHEIPGSQLLPQFLKGCVQLRPPLCQDQDGPGGGELPDEFFDGRAGVHGEPPALGPEFRHEVGITVIAGHGKTLAGNGKSQVAAEEAEAEDAQGAACGGATGCCHNAVTRKVPARYMGESGVPSLFSL